MSLFNQRNAFCSVAYKLAYQIFSNRYGVSALSVAGMCLICLPSSVAYGQTAQSSAALSPTVSAADVNLFGESDQSLADPWNVSIGGGLGVAPKYEGSARYTPVPVPYLSIKYGERIFFGTSGLVS